MTYEIESIFLPVPAPIGFVNLNMFAKDPGNPWLYTFEDKFAAEVKRQLDMHGRPAQVVMTNVPMPGLEDRSFNPMKKSKAWLKASSDWWIDSKDPLADYRALGMDGYVLEISIYLNNMVNRSLALFIYSRLVDVRTGEVAGKAVSMEHQTDSSKDLEGWSVKHPNFEKLANTTLTLAVQRNLVKLGLIPPQEN